MATIAFWKYYIYINKGIIEHFCLLKSVLFMENASEKSQKMFWVSKNVNAIENQYSKCYISLVICKEEVFLKNNFKKTSKCCWQNKFDLVI